MLNGLSWYGFDLENPEWVGLNQANFEIMTQRFPNCNLLSLPFSAFALMPNIESGDYTTINFEKLNLLKNFVSWCKEKGMKVLISNYWDSLNEPALTAFWQRMATEFKGESGVFAFDLINEPWAFAHGDATIIQLYERLIDAIRLIDPNRRCCVQSYLQHWEGYEWVRTNPCRRTNITYITHFYAHDPNTGIWQEWDWCISYVNHDYTAGKAALTTELQRRFLFLKTELGLDVLVSEVATIDAEEGLQYIKDLLGVLNSHGVSWAYHPYYTAQDRTISLTTPDGDLRPKALVVSNLMLSPRTSTSTNTLLAVGAFLIALGIGAVIVIGAAKKKLEELPQNVQEAIKTIADYIEET